MVVIARTILMVQDWGLGFGFSGFDLQTGLYMNGRNFVAFGVGAVGSQVQSSQGRI